MNSTITKIHQNHFWVILEKFENNFKIHYVCVCVGGGGDPTVPKNEHFLKWPEIHPGEFL